MAFSLNRVQLIGNLTRDPELRQTPSGVSVATFTVATNFSWTDTSGVRQEKSEFHNVVAWRRLAETCGQYLKKGKKVYVEGRLQTREWEGADGLKRYRTEIVLDNMIMLDSRRDMTMSGTAPRQNYGQNAYEKSPGQNSGSVPAQGDIPSSDMALSDIPQDVPSSESDQVQNAAEGEASEKKRDDEITIDDLPF